MRGVNIMLDQLWVGRSARLLQCLFSGLLTLMLVCGPAWSAEANKLLAVSTDSGAATPTVLIETAEPVGYRYTVYDSFEPTRVVIDFPGMDLSASAQTLAVNQGSIQEVRVTSFTLSSGSLARVEILLDENTEYQVSLDGKRFRVAFAAKPGAVASVSPQKQVAAVAPSSTAVEPVSSAAEASVGSSVLRRINISEGQAVLEANSKIDKFQYFTLGNPPRLVVDLYGLRPGFKERSFSAASGFDQVRVGTYNDKTRLVFDASGKALPEHTVEGRESDVLVSWKSQAAVVNTVKIQKSEAEPTVVAQKSLAPMTPVKATGSANVEAIDFANADGRSVITIALSSAAQVSKPVEDGNLVRFDVVNSTISRSLRRTIDASAFPSAVTSVTPYTVTDGDHQNVRIAVELKGPVAYALEQDGTVVRLVVDDAAYSEPVPPAVSRVEVVAPVHDFKRSASKPPVTNMVFASATEQAGSPSAKTYNSSKERISLDFINGDLRMLLRLIADVSDLNIIASSNVSGSMTIRLVDVPWDQALDIILSTNNLKMDLIGNVAHILTTEEYNALKQNDLDAKVAAFKSKQQLRVREVVKIQYVNMDAIQGLQTQYSGEDRSDGVVITTNKSTKTAVLVGNEVDVASLIKTIQEIDQPEKQVMIEVRIVEASNTAELDFGVKWGTAYTNPDTSSPVLQNAQLGLGGSFALSPPTSGIMSSAGSALGVSFGSLGISNTTLDLRLSALEGNGDVKIVSTPKIVTLNGNSATITQGRDIPYTSTDDNGKAKTELISASLNLTVIPEINPNGTIILDLDLTNDTQGPNVSTGTGSAPSIEKKTAKTKLLVRDGETTVIGGIFVESEDEGSAGVPLLSDIPILGHLFKSTNKKSARRELLIFITPKILDFNK